MSDDFEVVPAEEQCAKEKRIAELETERATWDRVLRSSVPERYKKCTSPVGSVQGYIAELEARTKELRTAGGILSNLLYNYAQTSGRVLVAGDCEVMKRHQLNWDKVVKKDRP